MTRPQTYLIRMLLFLLAVLLAAAVLAPQLADAFRANLVLNGLILLVAVGGVFYSFGQVLRLRRVLAYLERLKQESSGGLIYPGDAGEQRAPWPLGPMAKMLRERKGRLTLSAISMRTLVDAIRSRIDESHDISRYLIGLLIFLGLLGTFWGLVQTVDAVGRTIGSLAASSSDAAGMFQQLQAGLAAPLGGMGTAFSSSLFGLAGSLVLGFLELQAAAAHNRFMNELEEWLSGLTRLSGGGPVGGESEGGSVPAYLSALLEQTADSLDGLQRTIERGEDDRQEANRNLAQLTERMSLMTDQMRTEQEVLRRLAETHNALRPILGQLAEADFKSGGLDDATKDHIRSINMNLTRIAGEMSTNRDHTVEQIRSEIRLLARTIAALAEEAEG